MKLTSPRMKDGLFAGWSTEAVITLLGSQEGGSQDQPSWYYHSLSLVGGLECFGTMELYGIFDVSINIGNVRWTTDFHIFPDGWNHQPVTVDLVEATGKRNMGITEYAAGPVLVFFLTCGVVLSSLTTWTSLNYWLENLPWFEKHYILSNSKDQNPWDSYINIRKATVKLVKNATTAIWYIYI